MKKSFFCAVILLCTASIFAYNPPAGGQGIFKLSSPTQLASASSSAGGGLFMPGPESIAFNPSLIALEQRIELDAAFTALVSTDSDDDNTFNSAFQTGILIPTKRFVVSGILNGVFCDSFYMPLSDSLNFRAAFAKEVSDTLNVGIGLNAGYLWDAGSDWSLGLDIGALYRREVLSIFKDFRFGFALLNLGKYYDVEVPGINGEDLASAFPSVLTIRTGVAALILKTEQFKLGFSFDISTPCFQNVAFDIGAQFSVKDTFFLSIAEKIDVMELYNDCKDLIPAISLGVKFNLNAKNNEYLKSRSWDSSEMLTSVAWQQKYEKIQAISGGARLYLGQKDTTPPAIKLWD